jgi:hypothetical protein
MADEGSDMRLYGRKRGALEGLPLYLIILVVIAAVVIVILLGWLSTLQKASLGSSTVTVSGSYSDITVSGSAGDASGTPVGAGACLITVPGGAAASGSDALQVNTYDTHGNALNGVIVGVQGGNGVLNLSAYPQEQGTSGASPNPSGEVLFTKIIFTMPANTYTGTIDLTLSYSGGIAANTANPTISVSISGC